MCRLRVRSLTYRKYVILRNRLDNTFYQFSPARSMNGGYNPGFVFVNNTLLFSPDFPRLFWLHTRISWVFVVSVLNLFNVVHARVRPFISMMSLMPFERSRRQADHSLWGAMITDSGVALTVVQHQSGSIDDRLLLCAVTLSGEQRLILPHMYCVVLPNNQPSTNDPLRL